MEASEETRNGGKVAIQNFSDACERNKAPILAVLTRVLPAKGALLEIGSGSGQHALHFCPALPGLRWLPSELPDNLDALRHNLAGSSCTNLQPPVALDVQNAGCRIPAVDAVFTANTLHIMAWPAVEACFRRVGEVLKPAGLLCVYGPFRYGGRYTSASNADFDRWLKARDPASGIRDFEALDRLAASQGLQLLEDVAMPANNQLLVWRRDRAG